MAILGASPSSTNSVKNYVVHLSSMYRVNNQAVHIFFKIISHTIHVCYIYLHLVDFYGIHVGKYTIDGRYEFEAFLVVELIFGSPLRFGLILSVRWWVV